MSSYGNNRGPGRRNSLIERTYRAFSSLIENIGEILIVDPEVDALVFFSSTAIAAMVILVFQIFFTYSASLNSLILAPVFGLLVKLAVSSSYSEHHRVAELFGILVTVLGICLIGATADANNAYEKVSELKVIATAEIIMPSSNDKTLHVNSELNVVTDGNRATMLNDWIRDETDHPSKISENSDWFDVKTDDDVDEPYVEISETMYEPNDEKMGVLGKLFDNIIHYDVNTSTTVTMYLPEGIMFDYDGG